MRGVDPAKFINLLQRGIPRGGGVVVCFLFVAILALFIVPASPGVLDALFVLNIILSLTILLRGLLAQQIGDLFSFPLLLLLTTLFRLALNVSSTRLILSNGHEGIDSAGHVIAAFGIVVAQGEFIVGVMVFSVIALVNFLVITRGAGRVAEVSARFSLDSLPGRQLSIDSDLRAGVISREEGERRRHLLDQESQFYGAMDGAMKFVQGDAIACLLVVVLNGVGGVLFGVLRHSLDFGAAVNQYGVMALGDGLASVVPALLVSVSAGVVVTNSGSRGRSGQEGDSVIRFFADPRALMIAALSTFFIGVFAQFPLIPLLLGSGGLGSLAWWMRRQPVMGGAKSLRRLERDAHEPLVLVVSTSLLTNYLAKEGQPELALWAAIERFRGEFFTSRGFSLPAVSIREAVDLPSNQFRIYLREQFVRSGELRTDGVLVPLSPSALGVFGVNVLEGARHPIDSRVCTWISEPPKGVFELLGVELLQPFEVLALEVVGAAQGVVTELFGVHETKSLVAELQKKHRGLVDEVIGKQLVSYAELAEVLRRLVREGVSIRDLKLIFEAIAAFTCRRGESEEQESKIEEIHKFIRAEMSRVVVGNALSVGGKLRVFLLSSEFEEEFRSALSVWDQTQKFVPLDPNVETRLRQSVSKIMVPVLERGAVPLVVLCAAEVRAAVHEVLANQFGGYDCIRTLAYEELGGRYQAESLGLLAP